MPKYTIPDFGPSDLLDSEVIGERRVKVDSRINTDSDVIREYPSLSKPRMLTTGITQSEIATVEGDRYNSQKVYSNVDSNVPLYVAFENPVDSGVIVALQKRILKSFDSGLISFTVLWDYDISTATKTPLPIFNENNAYRLSKLAKLEINALNTLTSPAIGDWNVTGAATIADEGIEREGDFISTSGKGNNTSGDISPDLGFRFYAEGTGFVAKIITDNDNNRVSLGYDWIEVPTTL